MMFRKLSIVTSIVLVSACGGGGGDSQVTVTATAGNGGSITPASQNVAKGSQATLTIQPETNYMVQSVSGCGGTLEGNTYRIRSVTANCTVQASFIIRPFEAALSGLPEQLDEGSSGELVIDTSYATDTVTSNVTVSSGEGVLTLTKLSETAYRYSVVETDRDRNITLSWTAQDGNNAARQISGSVNLTITNSSFANQLASIQTFVDNDERLLSLSEEKLLITSLQDVAIVLGSGTSLSVYTSQNPELENAFIEAFQMLSSQLNNYLIGQSSDAELQAQFDEAMSRFSGFAAPYKRDIITYLAVLFREGMAPIMLSEFHITPQLGTVSLLVGNAELGAINDGAWVFNNDVAYIEGLLSNTGCDL